jgi:hypothetical protein
VTHRESLEVLRRLPVTLSLLSVTHRVSTEVLRRLPVTLSLLSVTHRESTEVLRRLPVTLFLFAGSLPLETMGDSTPIQRRLLAVLGLPEYQVPLLLIKARSIVSSMAKSSWFPSPHPSLSTVEAAIDALDAVETTALTGPLGTRTVRDEKKRDLVALLQQLATYVQSIADANRANAAAIIESADMSVKKPSVRPPRVFAAEPGNESGTVEIVVPREGKYDSFEFQMSADGKETWTDLSPTTKASLVVRGLTPGTTVWFRYRRVTNDGPLDWSAPVGLLVR